MSLLQRESSEGVQRALRRLGDGAYEAREEMDDGTPIAVRIEIRDGAASVDWSGTVTYQAISTQRPPLRRARCSRAAATRRGRSSARRDDGTCAGAPAREPSAIA